MSPDDLNLKLATLEGHMSGLTDAMRRIEEQLQKLVTLDRTVAEIMVRQTHTGDALTHVRTRIEENRSAGEQAAVRLHERVDTVTQAATAFHARVTGALYVLVALLGVITGGAGWVLLRVDENTRVNAVQEQRLQRLEDDLKQLRRPGATAYRIPYPALPASPLIK